MKKKIMNYMLIFTRFIFRKKIIFVAIAIIFLTLLTVSIYENKNIVDATNEISTVKDQSDYALIEFAQKEDNIQYTGMKLESLIASIKPTTSFLKSYNKEIKADIDTLYFTVLFYKDNTYIASFEVFKLKEALWIDNKSQKISFSVNNNPCLLKFHNRYWSIDKDYVILENN